MIFRSGEMSGPSHLGKERLLKARIFSDHAQANAERAEYLSSLGEDAAKNLDWQILEQKARKEAEEYLKNENKEE
jgi:hypothetical protein